MNNKLYIHIGWHKTATSFIQLYLDKYRRDIKEFDICYPRIDAKSLHKEVKHTYLYLSILNELGIPHKQQDLQICSFDKLFELSLQEISGSGCKGVVISEEGLSEPYRGIAKLLGRYKDHFAEIKVIAYLRRQDFFLESIYSQFVKQKPIRNSIGFTEYIQLPEVRRRADYACILDWWAEEFGARNILVSPFESRGIAPDPVTHFFQLAGLPGVILEKFPVETKQIHVTPPREITEYFRYMNQRKADFFVGVLVEYLLRSRAPVSSPRYLCRTDRERLLGEYADSNSEVARRYLKRDDGILFKETVRDYPDCAETWKGLNPIEILDYALPISGMMSHEIARLRFELAKLRHENSSLKIEDNELSSRKWRKSFIKKFFSFLK